MKTQQAFYSFSAGVMSPRTSMRADIERFASAMSLCDNFIVTDQGGIQMREGFEQVVKSSDPNNDSRVFQYHNGGDTSDLVLNVCYGNSAVDYYRDGVLLATTSHEFTEPMMEALYFTNRATNGVIVHQERPPYIVALDFEGNITGSHIDFIQVPLMTYDDDKSPSEPTNVQAREFTLTFGPTLAEWKDGDPYYIRYGPGSEENEPIEAFYFTNLTNMIGDIELALRQSPYLSSHETTIDITSAVTPGLVFDIIITGKGNTYDLRAGAIAKDGSDPDRTASGSLVDNNALQASTEPAWSYPFTVLHNLNYYSCVRPHYSEDTNEPGVGVDSDIYWTDLGTDAPLYFDWQFPNGSDWNIDTYYGPWDRGFPGVAAFHQQRLLFMNTPDAGTGLWGSRIGDYGNFTLGPQTDDAFYFDIDTSDTPDIRWAQAQRSLLLGTSGGDYAISATVTLSPSDIQAEKQNNARSHATGAVTINTDVFYIEQGQEKMRSTRYDDNLQAQTSQIVSTIAENLLYKRVKRITLQQTPQTIVYGLRDDLDTGGTLVAFTYSGEGMGAWFEFSSKGSIIDICSAYNAAKSEDELWALMTYNGVDRYLERMPYPARLFTIQETETGPTLMDQGIILMDGWTSGTIDQADNNVITGLEAYEGLTVGCIVQDAWTGEYTVKDGTIILDAAAIEETYAGEYAVGLIYQARATTFEAANGNQNGTALGTKRRWNKLICRVLNSSLPVINGTLPPDRTPETEMGVPEIIREGLQDLVIRNVGWDNGAITIVQDRPYPTHVLGVFGQFKVNNA